MHSFVSMQGSAPTGISADIIPLHNISLSSLNHNTLSHITTNKIDTRGCLAPNSVFRARGNVDSCTIAQRTCPMSPYETATDSVVSDRTGREQNSIAKMCDLKSRDRVV